MNKKMRFATALLLTFSILSNLTAQGWLQRYGTNSDRTSAQAVARTADNGYIFCGYSDGGTQLYIVKTDPEGGVLATRKYRTADDIQDAVKMVDAGDGTFLVAFATKNTPTNTKNISLYKIRPSGDTVWTRQFGDTNNERIGDIKRLADGNFIIVGTKFTTVGDSTAILKTDPQGQQLFFTTPQSISKKFATAIAESQNRSILFISFRPNGASDTARLVKLDANGTNPREVKIKAFGTNNDKFFSRIDALSVLADGNLAILGDYFAKVDTNGTVLWANPFVEFNASPKSLTQSQDGNFAVVGTLDETRQVSRSYFLKINATTGTTIGAPKQIGFIDNVAASSFPFHNAIIPTTDGGFILASEEIAGGSRARLMKLGPTGRIWTNEISGRVFVDNNNNCQQDGDDKPFLNAIVEAVNRFDPSRIFRTRVVDSFGYYTIALDSGTYDLRLRGVPPMWSACTDNISFNTDFEYKQAQRSFGLRPTTVLCPQLDVNVSTPFIRACSTSVYRVRYCNNGSATAQNTYVTLQLDSLLNFQNATIPAQLVGKRLYRFDIGSVEVGKCGGFDVRIAPDCGTAVKEGQTLCVKATIYPNDPCFISPNWSRASLKLEAICDADSLRFSVQNIGTSSSGGSSVSSIVVQDEVVFLRMPINTNTGLPQALPTLEINNGYTYRVSVPQVPNHPGNSRPTIAVEGCRKNSTSLFSLGKVNQFPEDDFDPFVDKECQILRGSAVNNELTALPVGYQTLHKIEPTDEIEYQINFRNRSTDTAFIVVVRDTLSSFLDPASVELGASSHPYRFQMFGENLMKFTFEKIKLPPNGATDRDEAAGFVKFRVKLKTTIPNNTRILNAANISTNFGTDVMTNETFHTVGQNFVLTATIDPPTSANLRIKVYPNPFSDKAIFEIEGKNTPLSIKSDFSLYDATGRLVRSDKLIDGRLEFERQNLPVGLYVFKIENDGKLIGSGKLMIKN